MPNPNTSLDAQYGPYISRNFFAVACYYLAWSAPLVFVIGIASLVVTRLLFLDLYPEQFVGTLPTISETASFPPGDVIFERMTIATTLCIVIAWSLNFLMNQQRLAASSASLYAKRKVTGFNALSAALGIAAGIFLLALAIIRLHDDDIDLHIEFSTLFFVSQVGAFALDAFATVKIRALCTGLDAQAERMSLYGRIFLASATVFTGAFFLFMYLGRPLFSDEYWAQALYVTAEYVLATLSFAYPFAASIEMLRHFRVRAWAKERRAHPSVSGLNSGAAE